MTRVRRVPGRVAHRGSWPLPQNEGMTAGDDELTIARFVLRARRIEAHSLVRDWDELTRHAQGSVSARVTVEGAVSVVRRLPEDEEAFESLAARVRPLTLATEPIHHSKVLASLDRLVGGSTTATERQRTWLQKLHSAWDVAELQGAQVQGYSVQSVRLDGSDGTPMVSDTQLAAGWLYADLVHADAKGPKKQALRFPLRERYAAAVRIFARIATLAVSTLRLVEDLRASGVVTVAEHAWDDAVIVGATELVEEAALLVAPTGTDVPDLREPDFGLTDDWKPITVTDLLRQEPANHVQAILSRADGSVVTDYAAAVARRKVENDVLHWQVLVAGSVMIHLKLHVEGETVTQVSLAQWTEFDSTNQLILASSQLRLEMHESEKMTFEVGGIPFITFTPPSLEDDALAERRVLAETTADITAIESMASQRCEPCTGEYNDRDRVQLRQARLILEGHVVGTFSQPVTTTTPSGEPPQAVVVEAGTLGVGGSNVSVPGMMMRHPAMTCRDLGPAPEGGPNARKFEVAPPASQRLLAWSPHMRQVAPDDELQATTSWDLTGIDEQTFPY